MTLGSRDIATRIFCDEEDRGQRRRTEELRILVVGSILLIIGSQLEVFYILQGDTDPAVKD